MRARGPLVCSHCRVSAPSIEQEFLLLLTCSIPRRAYTATYPNGRGHSGQRADHSRVFPKGHDPKEILVVFQSVDDVDRHALHDTDLGTKVALVSLEQHTSTDVNETDDSNFDVRYPSLV